MDTSNNQQLKELVEKNIALTEALGERIEKINRYIRWQRVFGALKFLLIVVPLLISLIYLPALLRNAFAPYQELLSGSDAPDAAGSETADENYEVFNIKNLLNELSR